MADIQPRVQAPKIVQQGEVFQVKTLVTHPMETGLRHDESGQPIARNLINTITCRYNGAEVFSVDLREAVAANPYLAFYLRATESGTLQFDWVEDGGAVTTVQTPLTVRQ